MTNVFIALAIGLVAGLVDVLPMIVRKLDKKACWSAFVHWVVLGLVIPFVRWDMLPWIKGVIIGELTAIPIMILVASDDKKALVPMSIFSAVLGAGVAIAGAYFVK